MKTELAILSMGFLSAGFVNAALSISSFNATTTIRFSSFTGAGFSATPTPGQLDSNDWKVLGMSDEGPPPSFGGEYTTGDWARGSNTGGGVTTGGVYAFNVGPGNIALGVQPGGSDFTPGSFVLRIQNNTGSTVSSWNLSYDLFVRNDQARSNSLNWEWSTDDTNYTSLSTYNSVETADASLPWSNVQSPSVNGLNAAVSDGAFLYLRWIGADVSGSGSRDEFAIDNISITAVPEAAAPAITEISVNDPAAGQVTLTVDGAASTTYDICSSADLSRWDDIGDVSTDINGDGSFIDTTATETKKFYRAAPQPLDGFGVITGPAFVLDVELTNSSPYYSSNSIDFADNPFDSGIDDPLLTTGGQSILASGSGGSSLMSQVFSFEVLARAEGAHLLNLGTDVSYDDPSGKQATFLVEIDGEKIGVTVARAVTYPRGSPYSLEMAETLLTARLNDVLSSSTNVNSADAWNKQILHIIADEPGYIDMLRTAWDSLSPSTKADTIVLVTATLGADGFLY